MKLKYIGLGMVCFSLCLVHGQTTQSYVSNHYSFAYPDTFQSIETLANTFNLYWDTFNEIFRFNPDSSLRANHVVILEDKGSYDMYISARIGETRNEFLFLKYQKPELSELVLYAENGKLPTSPVSMGPSLNRQLFLQYLYSFISEPPIWIRDGFQAYFESLHFDSNTQTIQFLPYPAWLETAKNLNSDATRALNSEKILSAVTGSFDAARFYPQAWAFISFLLNTEKGKYQRFLCETFIFLEGSENYNRKSQQENTDLIKTRFSRFNSTVACDADYSVWLSEQHTFAELLQSGVSAYNAGNYSESWDMLKKAYTFRQDDPMLTYYLGLVAYAEKDYSAAEAWYNISLKYGADISTVNWALALNAYAEKRFPEAKVFLEVAKTINPARYNDKATKLLNSMPK